MLSHPLLCYMQTAGGSLSRGTLLGALSAAGSHVTGSSLLPPALPPALPGMAGAPAFALQAVPGGCLSPARVWAMWGPWDLCL